MKNILKVFTLVLLITITSTFAQNIISKEDLCFSNQIAEPECQNYDIQILCESLAQYYPQYNYDSSTNSCLENSENITVTQTSNNQSAVENQISTIDQRLSGIEAKTTTLEQNLNQVYYAQNELSTQIQNINNQQSSLNSNLEQINSRLSVSEGSLRQDINSVSTGLAGLQNDLQTTQSDLTVVEEDLSKEKAFTQLLKYTFFVLLIIAITLGVIYYINRKSPRKEEKNIDEKTKQYITQQIKQGKKYPQIKELLLKAGWNEEDIQWAYKETIKNNYQKYKTQNQKNSYFNQESIPEQKTQSTLSKSAFKNTKSTESQPSYDKKKIMGIVAVTLLLIIGIYLLLGGVSAGKAYQILYTSDKELFLGFNCTPPHTFTPDKDGCCLDQDPINNICDYLDNYNKTKEQTTERINTEKISCDNHDSCPRGEYCINKECSSMEAYTAQKKCDVRCAITQVSIKTSDNEHYVLKPGAGSYTAAGSIDWKILPNAGFCENELTYPALIKITKKIPGQILGEEIIALKNKEWSEIITHPNVKNLKFKLQLTDYKYNCN